MKKKFKLNKKDMNFLILLFAFGCFVLGIIYFFAGLKNADLSANMMIIDCYYDLNLQGDMGIIGGFHSYEDWYLIGLRQLYFSMLFFVIGFTSLFFWVLLGNLK